MVHRQPLKPNDSDTTAQDAVCPRPFIEEAEKYEKVLLITKKHRGTGKKHL